MRFPSAAAPMAAGLLPAAIGAATLSLIADPALAFAAAAALSASSGALAFRLLGLAKLVACNQS